MALPDDTVICVAGDASILMNIQELGTLAQYNIPIKVVVVNNGWQGMVRQWQEAFYDERYSNSNMERGMPDFVKLAEAFGIKGMRVSHPDELQAAIAEMLAFDGPVFLDAIVKRDENCYPMVPSGHSNAQMLGLPKDPTLDLDLAIATCSSCGAKTLPSHKFCPDCGAKL